MSKNEASSLVVQIGLVTAEVGVLKQRLQDLVNKCKRIPDCKDLPRMVLALGLVRQISDLLSFDRDSRTSAS
jgi:hypothetical protein